MSKTSNQLEDVFQEVKEYFASVPAISVEPGNGSPPEQYTVTYNVNGVCKEKDGDVYSCDTHIISISLPFGFPHFPPNCLPESPTFHPDFDPSAVCIGDAWEQEKSVVQLILHIGQMITGKVFSDTNVFNEEAAEWYKQNSDQLPFDNADFEQRAEEELLTLQDDEDDSLDTIDTLDDDIFEESFTLESDEPDSPSVDVHLLQILVKQKRYGALSRELKKISDDFPERESFEADLQNAIGIADNLFREGEEFEHRGKQKEALEKFSTIESVVSDYPRVQEAKDRVQQAMDLLGDWVSGGQGSDEEVEEDQFVESPPEKEVEKPPPLKGKRTFFEEKRVVSKKWIVGALGIGLVALIATLVVSYMSLSSSLAKAEKSYTACQSLLEKDRFKSAEQRCSEALSFASEVRVVKQGEKKELTEKINVLLQSQKLKQGLAGRVKFEGKYVSIDTKKRIIAFKEAKKHGDSFFDVERWDEATDSYEKALGIAKNSDAVDSVLLAAIRQRLPRAQFNGILLAGEKALASSDWQGATDHFGKALELAKKNPNMLPEDITQIELLSNQAKFNLLRDEGHQAFADGAWSTALTKYQTALDLVKKLDLAESDTITSLHENIVRTKIYLAIQKGKDAFAASNWDEVVNQYEKAIVLLEKNSHLLSSINVQESGEKLSRIMLHAEIIKAKQELAKLLKGEEYGKAVVIMTEIKGTISKSKFATHPEFSGLLEELTADLEETKVKAQIGTLSSYLIDNFEELFLKHYPASTGSILSSPKVEFLENIGDKLLFRMQCTEKAGGRPLRLQMDYLYSPASKTWQFYTEQ